MGRNSSILALAFLLTVSALLAPFFFPIYFAALVALLAAFLTPLAPLAAGLLADALYYSPSVYPVPLWTLCGAIASLVSYGVRRFIQTSIMR